MGGLKMLLQINDNNNDNDNDNNNNNNNKNNDNNNTYLKHSARQVLQIHNVIIKN